MSERERVVVKIQLSRYGVQKEVEQEYSSETLRRLQEPNMAAKVAAEVV
jgi:hypothetical protein